MSEVKLLAVVGMSGSGKTTVVDRLKEKGVPKIRFGGIFYKILEEMGVEPNLENTEEYQKILRETEGPDFLIKRVVEEVKNLVDAGQKKIILDGLYTWAEYKEIKQRFPGEAVVAAVICSKDIRYKRVTARVDNDRGYTMDLKDIRYRDKREIEDLNKGGPIAMADFYLMNNGTIEDLNDKVDKLAREIGLIE